MSNQKPKGLASQKKTVKQLTESQLQKQLMQRTAEREQEIIAALEKLMKEKKFVLVASPEVIINGKPINITVRAI